MSASLFRHKWGTTRRNVSQGGGFLLLCRAVGGKFAARRVGLFLALDRKFSRATPDLISRLYFPQRLASAGTNNQANQ